MQISKGNRTAEKVVNKSLKLFLFFFCQSIDDNFFVCPTKSNLLCKFITKSIISTVFVPFNLLSQNSTDETIFKATQKYVSNKKIRGREMKIKKEVKLNRKITKFKWIVIDSWLLILSFKLPSPFTNFHMTILHSIMSSSELYLDLKLLCKCRNIKITFNSIY